MRGEKLNVLLRHPHILDGRYGVKVPRSGEVWRHYKGELYRVVTLIVFHTPNGDAVPGVLYYPLEDVATKCARSLDEWMGTVTLPPLPQTNPNPGFANPPRVVPRFKFEFPK